LAQYRCAVSEDERAEDVSRRLLRQPQQGRQYHLFGLALEHLKHRHALYAFLVEHFLEDRGFENAPDPQPDADHDDADQEWNAPAPDQELVAGKPAED